MVTEQGKDAVRKQGEQSPKACTDVLLTAAAIGPIAVHSERDRTEPMKSASPHIANRIAVLAVTIALSACSGTLNRFGIGGGDDTPTGSVDQALAGEAQPGPVDTASQATLRKYYGSGYCPIIEIRDGTEAHRQYVKQSEPSGDTIVWQASISKTARQCEEDPNGTMTIKVGISGRVLAGPKGGPADVTVPIRVVVVKYQEAVLASELYKERVTIGPELSNVFQRVYRIDVPSPGNDRDYIIYVGFDDGKQKD